jgi:hypothetical protein
MNITTIEAIDLLGALKAQIADLESQEKALKSRLSSLAPGAYEGDLFRLSISESVRQSPDAALKAKIEELVEEHVSRQFVAAHTNKTDVRTYRVVARNGKA